MKRWFRDGGAHEAILVNGPRLPSPNISKSMGWKVLWVLGETTSSILNCENTAFLPKTLPTPILWMVDGHQKLPLTNLTSVLEVKKIEMWLMTWSLINTYWSVTDSHWKWSLFFAWKYFSYILLLAIKTPTLESVSFSPGKLPGLQISPIPQHLNDDLLPRGGRRPLLSFALAFHHHIPFIDGIFSIPTYLESELSQCCFAF